MARRNDLSATWWSQQWIDALIDRAHVDPNRLPRGRTYARKGYVLDQAIGCGHIRASVRGSRPQPYRVHIDVRTFTDEEWAAVFAVIGSQVGHTAELLAGNVPQELLDDVRQRDVELLPTAGDLAMQCSCPDWAVPCKHIAAVCYTVAQELDRDPFGILVLRGKTQDEVGEQLRSHRSAAAEDNEMDHRGVLASEMWAKHADVTDPDVARAKAALWSLAPLSAVDERAASQRRMLWRESLVGLRFVDDVTDASVRARSALLYGSSAGATLDAYCDAARRVAEGGEAEVFAYRLDLSMPLVRSLGESWAWAGDFGVHRALEFNSDSSWQRNPMHDTVLAVLRDLGHQVKDGAGWVTLVGQQARLAGDPVDPRVWLRLERYKRLWAVVDYGPIDDIEVLASANR